MTSFEERMEQDRDWISWVPGGDAEKYHVTDMIVGRLVDKTQQDGDYGMVNIAVIELENEEPPKRVGVWLSRTVLRNEFIAANPQWGERVGIKYLGEQTKKGGDSSKQKDRFQNYRVKVDRGLEDRTPAVWGDSSEPVPPITTYEPAPATDAPVLVPSSDDDIPF